MPKVTFKLNGTAQLERAVARLEGAADSAILRRSVMDGAYIVERETKRRCPVRTGNLKNSYRSQMSTFQPAGIVQAETGTNVEYGPYVEFGTYKQRAKPHLRPALDENTDKIQRAIGLALKRELESL